MKIERGSISKDNPVVLENVGLYWHLVDVIWIFLFPLFYLVIEMRWIAGRELLESKIKSTLQKYGYEIH